MDMPRVKRESRYTDTFTRKTVYIEDSILETIQALASNRKGEQTRIVNAALSNYFRTNTQPTVFPDPSSLTRKTVYIEKNMLDKLIELSTVRGRQTQIINSALSAYLSDPSNVAAHKDVVDWYAKDFWKSIRVREDDK